MAKHKIKHYGWRRDLPDPRDFTYKLTQPVEIQSVNLLDKYKTPDAYNQYSLGSCTGNGVGFVAHFHLLNTHNLDMMPSRLFIYYNERVIEGTVAYDNGAAIRDGIKTLNTQGVCSELTWPYNIKEFATKPSKKSYDEALKYIAVEYRRVNGTSKADIVGCLLDGHPVVFGFTVFSGFESEQVAKTGVVNLPTPDESVEGGHCVVIVGYDKPTDRFIIRNSWGTSWGQKGYFTMPAAYVNNPQLAADFWIVSKINVIK